MQAACELRKEERSRAIAALGSGKAIGAVLGLLAAPYVIESFGWPTMFYSFGALGPATADLSQGSRSGKPNQTRPIR